MNVSEFTVFMRCCVTLAILVFVGLTAPGMISMPSDFWVWAGTADIIIGLLAAAVTLTTRVLDSVYIKIERAFTEKN